MKNTIIAFSLLSSIILASCDKGENKKPTLAPPTRVETIAAGISDISSSRLYSGTVQESSGTVLSFPVSGTLKSINVNEGDRVAKGQIVATLDQSTLRNAYDIAKATLDQAQDAYNRMKMLHDANSLPDMQWVEVQNTLKQAQSGLAIAERALKDAVLYAPASGYVAEKMMEPGMTVAPIAPVVKIVTINPIKVNISVPESEIASIQEGQRATITANSLGDVKFEGKLTEKGVSADPLTRAYNAKITIDNPDGILLPGMICDVALESDTPRQEIILPMSAVLLDANNQNFIWIKQNGKAAKRIVTVDGLTDDGIAISSGIAQGDSVIVSGQQKVSEGTNVVAI